MTTRQNKIDGVSRALYFLTLAVIVAVPFEQLAESEQLVPGGKLLYLLTAGAILLALRLARLELPDTAAAPSARAVLRKFFAAVPLRLHIFFGAWIVGMFVSALASADPDASLRDCLRYPVVYLFMLSAVPALAGAGRIRGVLLAGTLTAALPLGLFHFMHFAYHNYVIEINHVWGIGVYRRMGFLNQLHPNTTAMTSAMLIAFPAALIVGSRRRPGPIALLSILLLLALAGQFACASMTTGVSMAAAGILLAVIGLPAPLRKPRVAAGVALFTVLAATITWLTLPERMRDHIAGKFRPFGSIRVRRLSYEVAFGKFFAAPLVGVGRNTFELDPADRKKIDWHRIDPGYPLMFLETGLLGTLPYLALLFYLIASHAAALGRVPPELRAALRACLFGILVLVMTGFSENFMFDRRGLYLFWTLIAALYAIRRVAAHGSDENATPAISPGPAAPAG